MRTSSIAILLLASLLSVSACSGDTSMDGDGGAGADFGVDASAHMGRLLPECESMEPPSASSLPLVASTLVATVVPMSPRETMSGDLNPATEAGETLYSSMGYNLYAAGEGEDRIRRDDLGDVTAPMGERHSLAWFVQLSDFQLADDESPLRVTVTDNPTIPGGLRSQEAFLTHAVSAFNRTFTRIENPDHPYDFGIITGDCADSAQRNELRWVIEVMNGHAGMHVDSGDDNDPIPGPDNDPKDPFNPTPFPAPWLFVVGNHDVEVVGFAEVNEARRAQAIGTVPTTGTRDYNQWYAPITTRRIVADPEREIVDREDIVAALRADTEGPGPVGHGFSPTEDPDFTLGANYVYDAIPGLLRIVSFDTSDITGGSNGLVRRATIDNFLVPALNQAHDDHMLVIMASHHPTTDIDVLEEQLGNPIADAVPPEEIESIVAAHPEVIAWIVGHVHNNRIRAMAGADAAHPGYWEVMASAVADFPSQQRTMEIVDNGNGTLSLFSTVIDYDTESCSERRYRRLTQMEYLSAWTDRVSDDPLDHNVELIIPIPEAALGSVATASASAPTRIESETTLRGL
jgi:3',5'-cyclic AMP phosphodiesterase CpdA